MLDYIGTINYKKKNFQNMVQHLELYHATQEGCIYFWNMYDLIKRHECCARSCTFSGEGPC